MSKSLRAWMHIEPACLISASASHRIVTSRSVPKMRISFSPRLSMRMFDKIGIVDFLSTTPCMNPSSSFRTLCLIVNSILSVPLQNYYGCFCFYKPIQKLFLKPVVGIGPVDLCKTAKKSYCTWLFPFTGFVENLWKRPRRSGKLSYQPIFHYRPQRFPVRA